VLSGGSCTPFEALATFTAGALEASVAVPRSAWFTAAGWRKRDGSPVMCAPPRCPPLRLPLTPRARLDLERPAPLYVCVGGMVESDDSPSESDGEGEDS
jgi:hypothetical protein